MELDAARYLGAGLAMLCVLGVGLGIGNLFSAYLNAVSRNPSVEDKLKPMTIIGAAFTEALGIFALLVAIMMIVGVGK